jgi:hypothetical protein
MKTKDRLGDSTTSDPSLSKEGNSGLPSSDEEGVGVVGLCVLGVLCALA